MQTSVALAWSRPFERERLSQITEERIEAPKPAEGRMMIPLSILCSVAVLLMAVVGAVLNGIARAATVGGIVVCALPCWR